MKSKYNLVRNADGFVLSQQNGISNYSLYDITGKHLEQAIINGQQIILDFSNRPQGCYLLEVNSGIEKQVLKLIW
jgi:hypothetical protein